MPPLGVPVGGQQCRLDGVEQLVDRDAAIDLDRMQGGHVDVHASASVPAAPASSSSRGFGGEKLDLDNSFDDVSQRNPAHRPIVALAHHQVDGVIGHDAQPGGDRGSVGELGVDEAGVRATEMLLGGQRSVHPPAR